jgi:hypothetical protein
MNLICKIKELQIRIHNHSSPWHMCRISTTVCSYDALVIVKHITQKFTDQDKDSCTFVFVQIQPKIKKAN